MIFCRGDGHDVFDEKGKGADTLIFEDIKSDEVRIARFGSKLTINVNGSDDALELPGIYYTGFSGPLHHVEKVHFADGVVWTFDEMLAMARVEALNNDYYGGVIFLSRHVFCKIFHVFFSCEQTASVIAGNAI